MNDRMTERQSLGLFIIRLVVIGVIIGLVIHKRVLNFKVTKENFMNNPKCKLINPYKSELGKVSKKILSNAVSVLRNQTTLNNWKNTESVIEWFESLENKNELVFIQFDICEFHPSISEKLLKNALEYAKRYINITEEETQIILQAKKAFLFSGDQPWVKKGNKKPLM